jgi:hypothetical protein
LKERGVKISLFIKGSTEERGEGFRKVNTSKNPGLFSLLFANFHILERILKYYKKMTMYSIHDEEKVKEILAQNKQPAFRYAQIENAIYKNFVTNFDDIQTIPKELREILKENFYYQSLELDYIVTSANNQTTKMLFKTKS